MSNITRLGLTLCLTAVFALSACGGVTGDVTAINLKSGEKQTFGSEGEVPDGWATCPTPECDVLPPSLPCQNLSGEVCELNPACRVKVISCQGGGTAVDGGVVEPTNPAEPEPTDPPEPADFTDPSDPDNAMPYPTDPPEPGPTQTCEVVCLPKDTVFCQDLTDENACLANAECSWEMMCPAMDCAPGSECPPIPCTGQCFPKQPESCDALDEASCQARPDCNWLPQPCPLCPVPAPDDPSQPGSEPPADFLCECPSFCQPAQPTCPPIAYPDPGSCDGELQPEFDGNGCVVGYICAACPPVAMPMIQCENGDVLVEIFDENGCVVNWECKPVTGSCEQLARQYEETLHLAKSCDANTTSSTGSCTELVSDALFCPCVTYVNGANTAAIAELKRIEDQAHQSGCFAEPMACPAVACLVPQGASCEASSTNFPDGAPEPMLMGSCQDN